MQKIKVGIVGYGNLGRGVELALSKNDDMQLVDVFTRRDNVKTLSGFAKNIDEVSNFKNAIDVMIMCGGSALDLPTQSVEMLKNFNTVDSFDNHPEIDNHFEHMDAVGKASGHLGVISVGWDPGLFSIARTMFDAFLPQGNEYTFWGKGVSQGHSNAIREIEGVVDARQYTIPIESAVESVRRGDNPVLSKRQKHKRDCYVVAQDGADKALIQQTIVSMPSYFADYDTTVHFITAEEMQKNHSALPHGGNVLRSGKTSEDNKHILELSIKLDSNSEFTSSVLVAFARAVVKMSKNGQSGCVTALDIPLGLLSPKSPQQLRRELV
ncbi:MAG: diaminopimelate dehydrogenase [Clostridia bacterium]